MKKYRLQSSLATMVLCLFVSCSSPKQEGMRDITELPTYQVEGVKYNKEEIIGGTAWEFHRIGDNFFIFNALPNSAALVVRMSDCKELGVFMPKGMGPGECVTPRYAGCSAGEDAIYIYDTSKSTMTEFDFPYQSADTLNYQLARSVRSTDQEMYGPTCRLENGLSVSFRMSGTRHLFSLLDERMDTIRTFGSLPIPIEDDEVKSFIDFQCVMTSEKNTFYYASKLLPYMCAYEVKDRNNIELKFKHNYLPAYYTYSDGRLRMDQDKTIEPFYDLKINGDYIWTIYNETTANEIREDMSKAKCEMIVIFNKQGEPLAKYNLPVKGNHFCFSRDGSKMFLYTAESDIYEFDVDDFLKHIE